MKQTTAEYLLGKFNKLSDALDTNSETNPDWLINVIAVLNRNRTIDTITQVADALDSESQGNLADLMGKANDMWKTARVHPMFTK
jgi:hypothetical protein